MSSARMRPYLIGAGIGVLSWIVFTVVNAPIGISTALSEASGVAAMPMLGQEAVLANPYWAKTVPAWDYGTLFLLGTFLGALLSALASRTFALESVPRVWREHFGASTTRRFFVAFLGGILVMYGARMAGGCTSGHGISGSLQLALSSWVFFIVMFIAGVITAALTFRGSSKEGV